MPKVKKSTIRQTKKETLKRTKKLKEMGIKEPVANKAMKSSVIGAKQICKTTTKDSNNFFDISLSFGMEFNDNGQVDLTKVDLSQTQVFYNKECELFLEKCNSLLEFEVENKRRNEFIGQSYLGSWRFDVCDDEGNAIEGAKQVEGAVYITNINSHMLAKKCKQSTKAGVQWYDVRVVDVVFLDVDRESIANILDNAQHRLLKLSNGTLFHEMLWKYCRLHILTPPKSVVSCCSDKPFLPGSTDFISLLGHQTKDTKIIDHKLISKKLRDASFENISDYENIHIAMSNCNITQQFFAEFENNGKEAIRPKITIQKRYRNLALTCIIISVTMAKMAKLRQIQRAINFCFRESNDSETNITKEDLMQINLHIAELTTLWHEKTFIYPITEAIAQKIYASFRIDTMKEELSDLQETFERYMTMYISNEDVKAEKRQRSIFSILTLLSGLSTFLSLIGYFSAKDKTTHQIIILGVSVALLLFAISAIYILPTIVAKIKRKKRCKQNNMSSRSRRKDAE